MLLGNQKQGSQLTESPPHEAHVAHRALLQTGPCAREAGIRVWIEGDVDIAEEHLPSAWRIRLLRVGLLLFPTAAGLPIKRITTWGGVGPWGLCFFFFFLLWQTNFVDGWKCIGGVNSLPTDQCSNAWWIILLFSAFSFVRVRPCAPAAEAPSEQSLPSHCSRLLRPKAWRSRM